MSSLRVVKKFFPNVTKVVDARANAAIEVTSKDVSSAAVRNHRACAMAVACKRKFNLDGVIISRSVAYLVKGNRARRFKLPKSVEREIVSFDRGAGFAEGEYQLAKISPTQRLDRTRKKDDRDRSGRDQSKEEPRDSRFQHITANIRSVLGGRKV